MCGALLALPAGAAHAAEHGYARLQYELDDPAGKCANESTFRSRVVSRLGYDPFRDEAPLDLRVRIVARGPTVRAEITSAQPGSAPGKRTIEDPRCDALGETLASAVALVLDPVAGGALGASAPAPPPAPALLPAAAPPSAAATETSPAAAASSPGVPNARGAEAASEPRHAPPTSLAPVVYADFTTAFARTPTTLVGGRLGVGLRLASALGIALEGHVETSPASAFIAANDRVASSALSAALVPCAHIDFVELCGVATLGAREVKALDVVRPAAKSALFAVLGARAGVEVPLSRAFAVRANGELGVPLLRSEYTIDGIPRSTTGLVEASFGAGILGRFR